MTVHEDRSTSTRERLAELFDADGEDRDVPRFVTVALALVAAVLVAVSTLSAIETGHAAVGLSFLAAVVLFVASVSVFEAGRSLGGDG